MEKALQSRALGYNLPVLQRYTLNPLVCLLIAGCSTPVCGPELVADMGLCIAEELREGPDTPTECEPACSATLHQVCDGDEQSPSCVCGPGYQGNPCEWVGVLADPGFQDQGAWTLTNGANVLPFESGSIDDGVARVSETVACNAGAVSQTVEMPSYEVGEPLVAEVTYRAEGLFGLALGFNRAQTQLPATSDNGWRTERVCLGEAAYRDAVTVSLSSPEQHFSCFDEPEGDIEVDRLDLVSAEPGECPAPGGVLNGTGEVDGGGWQFETDGTGVAELAEGVGRGGTSGVRLENEFGSDALAWTRFSVPSAESLPSPALRFWWRGTTGVPFEFRIGRYGGSSTTTGSFPLDVVYGNDSDVNSVYCLPPWTYGNVVELISTSAVESEEDGPSELAVDDVEIVSDARCGTSTDVLDPGFDAGPTRIMGVTNFTPDQAATLVTNTELSRTGDGGALELLYSNEAAVLSVETWVLVPESEGDQGPAIVFWSNVPAANEKPIRSVLGRAAVNPADLQVGGGWVRNERCLPRQWSGRWFRVQWRLDSFPPIGDQVVEPPIRIYIDDLELTTSSACPTD